MYDGGNPKTSGILNLPKRRDQPREPGRGADLKTASRVALTASPRMPALHHHLHQNKTSYNINSIGA